jgi:hypothetical protein
LVPTTGVGVDGGVGEAVGSNPTGGTDGVGTGGVDGRLTGRLGVGSGGRLGVGTAGGVTVTGRLGDGNPGSVATWASGPEPMGVAMPDASAGTEQSARPAAEMAAAR